MKKLYGAPGCGSAIVEIMFILADEPYQWVNVEGFDEPGAQRDALLALNPLAQVPTLQLEEGEIITESSAIALILLDDHPQLAPSIGTPQRRRFYRLLVWLVANVYPTFTYGDYTGRWTRFGADELRTSTDRYREQLYLWLETQCGEGPYLSGAEITLLDAWPAVMISWRPGEEWFRQHTPRLYAIAQKVRERKELREVLSKNRL